MTQYAISTWIVEDLESDEAVEHLAVAGFKQVELSGGVSPLLKAWEDDPVGVREQLDAVGIGVPSIHCPRPGRHLDADDDTLRRSSIAANIGHFERMRTCGVEEIVIHPTSSADISTDAKRAASRARSVESLRALAEQAAQMGVRMAVENLGRAPRPASTMAELLQMIEGLGDHVGVCLDIGHTDMADLHLLDELGTVLSAGKLFSLHIHDVSQEGKDHFLPGEGRLDFDAFLAKLDASDFHGLRTLEILPPQANVVERLREAAAVRNEWEARRRAGA